MHSYIFQYDIMLAYENIYSAVADSDGEKIKNILNDVDSVKVFVVNFKAIKRKSKNTENRVCV
jgi:hypothetical protein